MNLKMIRSKNETENLLISNSKNCETLIQQTHRKPEETLEFEMNKPRETFHFNPPKSIEGSWMLGLTSLEVYNSIFNIIEENNKSTLYKFPDEKRGRISFEKVRDEIEKELGITNITPVDLQDNITSPIIIEEYGEHVSKRKEGRGYTKISAGYISSVFQDFES